MELIEGLGEAYAVDTAEIKSPFLPSMEQAEWSRRGNSLVVNAESVKGIAYWYPIVQWDRRKTISYIAAPELVKMEYCLYDTRICWVNQSTLGSLRNIVHLAELLSWFVIGVPRPGNR